MRALVTGGAGFIGSNLVNYLINKGVEVRVIDNLSTGFIQNLDLNRVNFINGDITKSSDVLKAVDGMDVVFHLAASVGRQKSIDNPIEDSEINILGTLNILEAMKDRNVRKLIYSSSAAIFGEPITKYISEEHQLNPNCQYGVSKLAAEKMILAYSDLYGIQSICLRYFNIYGKNQRFDLYGNVIPIFVKRAINNEPISIYGSGNQTRDFINVLDVAKINYLAALINDSKQVINLGTGQSISIIMLANMIIELVKSKSKIHFLDARNGDVEHAMADSTKLKTLFDFKDFIGFKKGLEEYINWFKLD